MTPQQRARYAHVAMKKAADARVASSQRRFFKPWEKVNTCRISTPGVRQIAHDLHGQIRKTWTYTDASDLLRPPDARRAGVVAFVKPSGKGAHLDTVYRLVPSLAGDEQDLMHKACGWLLREAGISDARRLERFLHEQGSALPRTTVRYAIERVPEARRRKILARTRKLSQVSTAS